MPTVTTQQIAVGATAVQVLIERQRLAVLLRNTGTGDVFVGPSTVTSTSGWPLRAGEVMTLGGDQLSPGGEVTVALWAVSPSGSSLAVLEVLP